MAKSRQPTLLGFVLLLVVVGAIAAWQKRDQLFGPAHNPANSTATGAGEYLFCVWNVENLFDDKLDKRHAPDDEYDKWFAENAADRELKYQHLSEALLRLNDGKGPDVIAVNEIETVRAAELLRDELNKRLPAGTTPYGEVHMKEVAVGRHIAPAVLTRLKVTKTKGFGKDRLLHVDVEVNGQELVIFVAHWTSHRTDEGTGGRREHYADLSYGSATKCSTLTRRPTSCCAATSTTNRRRRPSSTTSTPAPARPGGRAHQSTAVSGFAGRQRSEAVRHAFLWW